MTYQPNLANYNKIPSSAPPPQYNPVSSVKTEEKESSWMTWILWIIAAIILLALLVFSSKKSMGTTGNNNSYIKDYSQLSGKVFISPTNPNPEPISPTTATIVDANTDNKTITIKISTNTKTETFNIVKNEGNNIVGKSLKNSLVISDNTDKQGLYMVIGNMSDDPTKQVFIHKY